MANLSTEIEALSEEFYVVAAKTTEGKWVYFRGQTVNDGITDHPTKAAQFPLSHDRTQFLEWIEDQISRVRKMTNSVLMDTVTIVKINLGLEAVDVDNHDWKVELRRRAVSKLTGMEIRALELEGVEMERRLASK